ncbi:MAG: NAD(P)-dependent oxidoreductase [Proteobacteria bacterium SG_bin7]|nr:MAG: NAD(P)-dependent oxidoreductase [Proteobacteria bacterium SG_bin7]
MVEKGLAIITGATAGIGEATAELLAIEGYDLILTGRRKDRLEALAKRLGANGNSILPLCFDVSNKGEVESSIKEIEAKLSSVTILINNAGLALGTDLIPTADLADWDQMIDTNVKGLLYMTRLIVPHMIRNKSGHIINIGSVAGRWSYRGGAVYCATKFAVRAISEGLRMDIAGSGVRVTNIEPGMVDTEFSVVRFGDEKRALAVYEGLEVLSAKDIAECILWTLTRPPHVNIQEMVVFPTDQAAVGQVHRRGEKE